MNLKSIIAAALVAVTATQGARAHETAVTAAPAKETMGVGSGVVIGALAAGPIGAIVGATAGAWIGDRYAKNDAKRAHLEQVVAAQTIAAGDLTTRLATDQDRYAHLVASVQRLETDVAFKTNEATLSAAANEHLRSLGVVLAGLPEAKVRVTGFADPRGSVTTNMALSQRRADVVVGVLSQAGVRSDQLIVEARGAGDVSPDATTLDDFALERRTSVRLESPEKLSAQR